MVAINFSVFTDQVASGAKRMTIRQTQRCKPGDRIQLYTGMRQGPDPETGEKRCKKLRADDPVCTGVFFVTIEEDGVLVHANGDTRYAGSPDDADWLSQFAALDGFDSFDAMKAFFRDHYGLPFSGWVHEWDWAAE